MLLSAEHRLALLAPSLAPRKAVGLVAFGSSNKYLIMGGCLSATSFSQSAEPLDGRAASIPACLFALADCRSQQVTEQRGPLILAAASAKVRAIHVGVPKHRMVTPSSARPVSVSNPAALTNRPWPFNRCKRLRPAVSRAHTAIASSDFPACSSFPIHSPMSWMTSKPGITRNATWNDPV